MLEMQIESSSGEGRYTAKFWREQGRLLATCTCPAGQKGTHCKHRLSVLVGDFSKVAGVVSADVQATLVGLLSGSDVEAILGKLSEAEERLTNVQSEIKNLKKTLDRAMHA